MTVTACGFWFSVLGEGRGVGGVRYWYLYGKACLCVCMRSCVRVCAHACVGVYSSSPTYARMFSPPPHTLPPISNICVMWK